MIKLNRRKLYIIGLCVMIFYCLLNRVHFIADAKITTGIVTGFFPARYIKNNFDHAGIPVVMYLVNDTAHEVAGAEFESCAIGDTYKVVYKKDDPEDAHVFSFASFWITPFFWSFLPFMLWSAFAYSFVNKNEIVVFDLHQFRFSKRKNETGIMKWKKE